MNTESAPVRPPRWPRCLSGAVLSACAAMLVALAGARWALDVCLGGPVPLPTIMLGASMMLSWWLVPVGVLLVAGIVQWALRRRRSALGLAAVAVLMAGWAVWSEGAGAGDEGAPSVQVMTLNTLFLNRDTGAIARLIVARAPDIVCFQEFEPSQHEALEVSLGHLYPYRHAVSRENHRGLGIYSRYPLEDLVTLPIARDVWQGEPIAARVRTPLGTVRVVCVHLPSPQSPAHLAENLAGARELARYARAQGEPTIIAGDHNFGPLAPQHAIMRAGGLRDAYSAFGPGAGMSVQFCSLPTFLCTRIDYLWCTSELGVLDSSVGPDVGSDHRPVFARLTRRRAGP